MNEISQKLVWVPGAARMFGVLGVLAGHRSAQLTYYLSDEADHQRGSGRRITLVSVGGGVIVGMGAVIVEWWALAAVALVVLFIGAIVGARTGSVFRLMKIENGKSHLRLRHAAAVRHAERAERKRRRNRSR